MNDYIKDCTDLIEYTEYNLSKASYKDAKTFHKNMLKMLNFELKLLKICNKLCQFRLKMLKFC